LLERIRSVALLVLLLALVGPLMVSIPRVHADTDTGTVTWKGATGTWENPTNWSSGSVPTDMDDVQINSGSVTISSVQTVGSLTIANGATVNCKSCVLDMPTGDIVNSGTIASSQGNITIEDGDFNNTQGGAINNGPNSVLYLSNGAINNAGTITNGSSSSITLDNGELMNNGTINNCAGGKINVSTDDFSGTPIAQVSYCLLAVATIPFA